MPDQRTRRAVEAAVRVITPWIEHRRVLARVPGVSVGIVHGDRILFRRGYGYANLARRIPATDTTCYRIASITKTFTATAVMQLVEAGACQLDDRVQKFLPWFRSNTDPRLARITLRHLLTHMAGVERDGDTAHWANDRFPTIAHIRNLVGAGCTVYSPLETFKYSNLGYAILGQVIATISGRSYEEYIEERIIRRLGLTHTSPTLTTAVRAKLAVGYGRDLPPKPRASFPSVEANAMTAAAGVTSNAVDLCHYMSAQFLGNSRLLSDESKREMQRIHWVNTKTDAHYGLGYDISKVGETRIVGHGGGFSGFITRIGMDPAQKIGIAVLTNALEDLAGELVNGIFSTIQYFTKRGARLQAPRTRSAGLARHEGTFSSRWYDAVVVNIGGRLVVFGTKSQKPMEEGFVLEHLHGHEFRISAGNEFGNLGEKAVFQFDRRGRVARLVWGPTPMKASHVG